MSDKNHRNKNNGLNENVKPGDTPEINDMPDETESDSGTCENGQDTTAELQNKLEEALRQVEKDKNDYLLLAADFDNYRKRMMREKADLLKNAAERTLLGLLPIVDDFERGLAAIADEDADSIRKGMELIYHKLIKYLEANGVKAMETNGELFNADFHEAIATIPAPDESLKGKIIDTTQKGYMINDKVLRHAKVAVGE